MRRYLWLGPLLAGALLAGCNSARIGAQPPAHEERIAAPQAATADQVAKGASVLQAAGPAPVRTGSVSIDLAKLKQLQVEVDRGHKPGNLDPEEVVREAGQGLGLDPAADTVRLEQTTAQGQGSGGDEAYVYVLHAGREYVVQLIQPVKPGPGGIWAVNSVRDIGSKSENDLKLAVLQRYFKALAAKDYQTAYDLMSRRFRQGLPGPVGLSGNSIEQFQGVSRVPWFSPGPNAMYVEIRLKLSRQNASAWGDGSNDRFASFVQEDGAWRIDALATSP